MSVVEDQQGVTLVRPFLQEEKETVYAAAKALAVPYLKNTTPSWSNRGKFREHFHGALVRQYGPEVDKKIIQFAEAITKQSETLDRIVFQPIYDTWIEETKTGLASESTLRASFAGANTLDISKALQAKLDVMGWSTIFEHVCHKKLGVNKPSGKCIAEFVTRLGRCSYPIKLHMHMHKKLYIHIDSHIMYFEIHHNV
jgi:hypothetical protein